MERPCIWLTRALVESNEIKTLAYRCVESYEKLLEAEYKFGKHFRFSTNQLQQVGLPPINQDELIDVLWIYSEYKLRDYIYWTM